MVWNNTLTIKDYSSVNVLWEGEEVLMLGTKISLAGGNTVMAKPKTFQNINLSTADIALGDTSSGYVNNYNRRKSNVSYSGLENQKIAITCLYNPDEVGATIGTGSDIQKIFTPNKLYELILKPRTVYLKDEFIINLLTSAEGTSPALYSSKGIPIILDTWTITPTISGKEVQMTLGFQEDKGV